MPYPNSNIKCEISPPLLIIRYNGFGQLKGFFDNVELLIGDLFVQESHRNSNQKIGTHLLRSAISSARELNLRRVRGNITEGDLKESDFLVDWYEKEGFTITDPFDVFAKHGIELIL